MDLIYSKVDENGIQEADILKNYEADFDITSDIENNTNDFTLKMNLPSPEDILYAENSIDTFIYIDGTEYGGEIKGYTIDLEDNVITYIGRTWRGTFQQYIIEPPAGQDYRTVSGNMKTIIEGLPISPFIEVMDTAYTSPTYQFERYITSFDGITKLLTNANSSLRFDLAFNSDGYGGKAEMTIAEQRNLKSLIELSQDYNDNINLKITRNPDTPKRLICLGEGELRDREVINLYADDNWNVSTTPIPGAYPVETYEYAGSESLLDDGKKKFAEYIGNHQQIEVNIDDLEVRLGDIVGARDHITEQDVEAEITGIVLNLKDFGTYQQSSYSYSTKVRI